MNAKLLFDAIYIAGSIGIFGLLLCVGEEIINTLYRVSHSFRRWYDGYCKDLPDWDDERISE